MEKDKDLQRLLKYRDIPETSDNLTDHIMLQIQKESVEKSSDKDLKLVWIFFVFGFAFGILLSTFWINHNESVFGVYLSDYKLFVQIFCVSVILVLFEKIYNYSHSIKKKLS